MVKKDNLQLEIDFGPKRNRMADNLAQGKFSVFVEVNSPPSKSDFKVAGRMLSEMEAALHASEELQAALAITDRLEADDSWNVADFASELNPKERDRHMIFVSGKGLTPKKIEDTLMRCKASGFPNIVPVSGDRARDGARNTDSVNILELVSKSGGPFFNPGCVVSPFKYAPCDSFAQYHKLVKKLARGAKFAVTQAGWDMHKLQELRWYLEMRELHYPSIARLMLLTPEKAELLQKREMKPVPGVHISPDFRRILENEAKFGFKQFGAAQWRRLQIQAAGCRLLGYSGIIVSGLDRPEHVDTVCSRVNDALREFKTFDDWREAYNGVLGRSEMAPYPDMFYVFKKLFSSERQEKPVMNADKIPGCSSWERTKFKICNALFGESGGEDPHAKKLLKKMLVGCRGCNDCRLDRSWQICPETCPKGLANGPCGGSKPDGSCECSPRECIFARQFRLAFWSKELELLEERVVPTGKE